MRVYKYTPGTSDAERRRADEAERIRQAARAMQQGRGTKFMAVRFRPGEIERAKVATGRK